MPFYHFGRNYFIQELKDSSLWSPQSQCSLFFLPYWKLFGQLLLPSYNVFIQIILARWLFVLQHFLCGVMVFGGMNIFLYFIYMAKHPFFEKFRIHNVSVSYSEPFPMGVRSREVERKNQKVDWSRFVQHPFDYSYFRNGRCLHSWVCLQIFNGRLAKSFWDCLPIPFLLVCWRLGFLLGS